MPDEKRDDRSKRTRAVIDRIEENGVAVLLVGEDEEKVELPAALLPEGAEGGSHLFLDIALDEASRREAEERVKALQEKLEKRSDGGQKSFKL